MPEPLCIKNNKNKQTFPKIYQKFLYDNVLNKLDITSKGKITSSANEDDTYPIEYF